MRIKHLILGMIAALLLLGATGQVDRAATVKSKGKAAAKSSSRDRHGTNRGTVRRGRRIRRRRAGRVRGQQKPTEDRMIQIQTALANAGTYHGKIDGIWGKGMSDAVREFQSSRGLTPTGKIDARTLQKLGLGSQVAGIAAPVPTASSDQTSGQQNP
jgi:peptidoglycan hydrolase-like protein with peptidoglycan-binding domain